MRDNRHKTRIDDKLIWWGYPANETYWFEHFARGIEYNHNLIAEGKIPKYLLRLTPYIDRDSKALEAGCGTGWFVSALLKLGYTAEGIDSSPALIARVLEKYPSLPVRDGDVLDLQVSDGYYGTYLSFGVIEHRWEGPEPFLQEAFRVLKPGGIACISVPYFNALRLLKAKLKFYAPQAPEGTEFYQFAFTKQYFKQVLTQQGFKVLELQPYGTQWCVPEEVSLIGKILRIHRFVRARRYMFLMDYLDGLRAGAHMIMAVAQKPG